MGLMWFSNKSWRVLGALWLLLNMTTGFQGGYPSEDHEHLQYQGESIQEYPELSTKNLRLLEKLLNSLLHEDIGLKFWPNKMSEETLPKQYRDELMEKRSNAQNARGIQSAPQAALTRLQRKWIKKGPSMLCYFKLCAFRPPVQ